jgi:hypothetical protein
MKQATLFHVPDGSIASIRTGIKNWLYSCEQREALR